MYAAKPEFVTDVALIVLSLSEFITDINLAQEISTALEKLVDHVVLQKTLELLLNSFDLLSNGALSKPARRLRALSNETNNFLASNSNLRALQADASQFASLQS